MGGHFSLSYIRTMLVRIPAQNVKRLLNEERAAGPVEVIDNCSQEPLWWPSNLVQEALVIQGFRKE